MTGVFHIANSASGLLNRHGMNRSGLSVDGDCKRDNFKVTLVGSAFDEILLSLRISLSGLLQLTLSNMVSQGEFEVA